MARRAVSAFLGVAVALAGATAFAFAANQAPAEQTIMVENGATVDQDYLKAHGLAVDDTFHIVLAGSAVFDNISVNSAEASAVLVTDPETKILIKGATSFVGAENCAGIEVPQGKKVTIKGKEAGATLIAVGNRGVDYATKAQAAENKRSRGAGIGGTKDNPASGEIIIKDIDGKLSARGCGAGAAGIGSIRAENDDIELVACNLQGVYGGCQISEKETSELTGGPAVGGGTDVEGGGTITFKSCTGAEVIGGANVPSVGFGAVLLESSTVGFGYDGNEDVGDSGVIDIEEQDTALAAPDTVDIDDGRGTGSQIDTDTTDTGNVGGEVEVVDGDDVDDASVDDDDDGDATSADESDVDDDESADEDADDELETPATETGEMLVYAGFVCVLVIAAAAAASAVIAYRRGKKKPSA